MPPGRHVVRALDAAGARFRASAALSFTGPLHQPRAGIPAGTDEMFVVLHLLSHGASWRTFDFLGYRIQRRIWRGRAGKRAVYTYPSKKALASVMEKVRTITRRHKHRTLADLLRLLNRVLRGWCNYFRVGVSAQTFRYLDHYTWWRVAGWVRKRHNGLSWGALHRRHLPGWEIRDGHTELFRPQTVATVRYRYRGARIPTPWAGNAA